MRQLLVLMVLCPLLGFGVVASVVALGFAVAWLPRRLVQLLPGRTLEG